MSNQVLKHNPPPPGTSVPPQPSALEAHYQYLLARRQAILFELSQIDAQLVTGGKIKQPTLTRRNRG